MLNTTVFSFQDNIQFNSELKCLYPYAKIVACVYTFINLEPNKLT